MDAWLKINSSNLLFEADQIVSEVKLTDFLGDFKLTATYYTPICLFSHPKLEHTTGYAMAFTFALVGPF